MEFWTSVLETIIRAAFIAAVAYGGILCGMKYRTHKNTKKKQDTVSVNNAK